MKTLAASAHKQRKSAWFQIARSGALLAMFIAMATDAEGRGFGGGGRGGGFGGGVRGGGSMSMGRGGS